MDNKLKNVIATISDAIVASGKKLNEIDITSINDFLAKSGVPKQDWESIYNRLRELHNAPTGSAGNSGKEWKDANWSDDLPSTATTVSQKQPRKNVFGQIKKIAG